jgi:hypothetical protein
VTPEPDTNDAVACGPDGACDIQSRHAIVESDHRAGALNAACSCRTLDNVRKYGTVFNTVAPGTDLSGELRRKAPHGDD